MSLSFSRRKPGLKGLAKPLAWQTHIAQRLLPILWIGSYEMQESCKMLTAGIRFFSCPSQRTMMDASIQNRCGHQGHQWTTGWPLCECMREMLILQYSQCLWFEGCRVYHFLKPSRPMAVNNWIPAIEKCLLMRGAPSQIPDSWKVHKQLWRQVLLHLWGMQQISNRNSNVPFASILCLFCDVSTRLQLRFFFARSW